MHQKNEPAEAGLSAPKPNLFLIGSMKSATTYLSELIGSHPAVFMSVPKEPCYFVDQRVLRGVWLRMWEQGYWRSMDRYLGLFANAGDASILAEASTVYAKVPIFSGVPERILSFNPDARFIYVMRDPVERAISHYWHRVRFWGERRSVMSAIRGDPQYRDTSHYSRQLEAYLRYVPLQRIYVLTYETLLRDPRTEVGRIYAWLGVDSLFRPPKLYVPANVMPACFEQARGRGWLHRMSKIPLYEKRIGPYVPPGLRKLGTALAVRSVKPAEVPLEEVKAYLRPIQRAQTQELGALLGRAFPEWETLYRDD